VFPKKEKVLAIMLILESRFEDDTTLLMLTPKIET